MHEGGHSARLQGKPGSRRGRPATVGPAGRSAPRPPQVGGGGGPRPRPEAPRLCCRTGWAPGHRERAAANRRPKNAAQAARPATARGRSSRPPASRPGGGAGTPKLRLRRRPVGPGDRAGATGLRLRRWLSRARAQGRRAESAPQRPVRSSPGAGPAPGTAPAWQARSGLGAGPRLRGRSGRARGRRPRLRGRLGLAPTVAPGFPGAARPPGPAPGPAPRRAGLWEGRSVRRRRGRRAGGGGGGGRGRRGQTKPRLMNGSVRPRRPSSAAGREPRRPEPSARGECAAGGRSGLCLGRELAPRARPSRCAVGGRGPGRGRGQGARVEVGSGSGCGAGGPGAPRHCLRRAGGGFGGAACGGLDPARAPDSAAVPGGLGSTPTPPPAPGTPGPGPATPARALRPPAPRLTAGVWRAAPVAPETRLPDGRILLTKYLKW